MRVNVILVGENRPLLKFDQHREAAEAPRRSDAAAHLADVGQRIEGVLAIAVRPAPHRDGERLVVERELQRAGGYRPRGADGDHDGAEVGDIGERIVAFGAQSY